VNTHSNIGFTPFLDRNIRELKSSLPLTIFDKEWKERALTWHVEKQPKNDDSGSEKTPRYTGLPYHSEWSQIYATWTMNHRTFNDLLRNVYDLGLFADWMLVHKSHVDNLHKHHGFMPAFRYDIMTRANTFSHRVYDTDGSKMVPDISKFKTNIWQIVYSQSQKFNKLGFTDNPYVKNGERENWDPLTGEEKGPKMVHSNSNPYNSFRGQYPEGNAGNSFPSRNQNHGRGGFGRGRGGQGGNSWGGSNRTNKEKSG
jgi:hypothetical protein